jgi:putative transcriptional regulator
MPDIKPGLLLISDPFLKDPNFMRTVILLCEHQPEGSMGFVLNKKIDQDLSDLIDNAAGIHFPIYQGGPVQTNTLHFIHRQPDLIAGGIEILDGVFWGGDFEEALKGLQENKITENDIRFFLGYSGWGSNQLATELAEKSWITRAATVPLIFEDTNHQLWKKSLAELGGEYAQMTNYPIDPQLN